MTTKARLNELYKLYDKLVEKAILTEGSVGVKAYRISKIVNKRIQNKYYPY